ncbi:MAG: hypothetical protein ACI832_000415 [Rheinheimera aquimaris]
MLRFYYLKYFLQNSNPIANAISNKNRLIKPQDATSVQLQALKTVKGLYNLRWLRKKMLRSRFLSVATSVARMRKRS